MDGELVAFPDTLVGTDSHTTMINGVGVLGFGVGGIEAEAVLLGQPLSQPTPTGDRAEDDRPHGPGDDGDRPRPDGHRDAPRARRGGQVRGALRRRAVVAHPRRPRDHLEHVARVRGHGDHVPDRRRDPEVHGDHRPPGRDDRPHRGLREGPGALPHRRRPRPRVRRDPRARPVHGGPEPRRPAPAAGPRGARARWPTSSARSSPTASRPTAPGRTTPRCEVEPGGRELPAPDRLGGHRGHHQLHQHLEPVGDGGRGPARQEGRRARPDAPRPG